MKKIKLKQILMILSFLIITISTSFIVYAISLLSGIENIIRLLIIIILIMIWLCSVVSYLKILKKPKTKYKIATLITIIYSVILIFIGYYINKTYSTLTNMTSNSTSYSTSLVTLSSNKVDDIKTIKDETLGILSDSTNIVGNQIPLEEIEKNNLKGEVKEYDSFIELIKALLNGDVIYAFLPTNYEIMFSSVEGVDFSKIGEDTKIIYTKTKKVKEKTEKSNKLDKPFTILLMGVDSELESIANASFNGDSLMLITFNPNTLSSTILSIPRDSYVPITCFAGNRKNKITHAAWYGEKCMIETIENYTGVNIDYYVKINFKGVVKLVDTLGGIDVDVPYAFCEQNSNREWGTNTVYVEKGQQTLNGEQALAFARNRHSWPGYCPSKYTNYISNDFIRGQHQQIVVKELLNKLKSIRSLNTLSELLNTISNSMETNMTTNEMLSLYNVGKDILVKSSGEDVAELVSMQRLYLNGYDAYIYDPSMKLDLYNYVIYDNSLKAVVDAMKENLGLKEVEAIKEFSFTIDEPYEEEVIGQKIVGKPSISKLPDFTGDTESQARSTCSKLGINVSIKYTKTGVGTNNTVISQNYKSGTDVSTVGTLTLTILQEETKTPTTNTTNQTNNTTTNKVPTTNKTPTETKEDPKEEDEPKTEEKVEEKEPVTKDDDEEIKIDDVTGVDSKEDE